ncbi:unnamed protein product [Adineta steineri]|uniref:DNA-directed RNA polymerases I, II, and III subunit RPABC1 n=1 Tax=Adineta steineri TaxID=433720 RepID=A0A814EH81_9BILA|nr:unnamed protein product [Adineta steineri]
MDDEALVYNLWRIRRTSLQICHDRGYLISQEELDQSFEQFKDTYGDKPSENKPARSHLNILVAHNDDPTNTLIVRFCDQPKLGVKEVKEFCRKMEDENLTSTILVVQTGLTPVGRDVISNELDNRKIRFQVFLENELLVNITEHTLVPKHIILTPEEKQELLQRYRLKENQLPRIQSGDPVARYFGLTRGQVVRITRASETAGRYITYRLVT